MTTFLQSQRSPSKTTASYSQPQVTIVHSGARDGYQVALALEEAKMLTCLVTDLFWPSDRPWARAIARMLPAKVTTQLKNRSESQLPSAKVRSLALRGLTTWLTDRLCALGLLPQAFRRSTMRQMDASLGRSAGALARQRKTALLSYSYYAYDAFKSYKADGLLFQLHPHPASMRRILLKELTDHPQCADSLNQEWELALPRSDYDRLSCEPAGATHIIAASSFTRHTLVENGIEPNRVTVIPYGVNSRVFHPGNSLHRSPNNKLRLLFVGRINQRKGVHYLLESLRLLATNQVELTVCGRVVDDLAIFRPFRDRVVIRPDVSHSELVAAYQCADLFVFPSVAEGFGQVLLESLACGLPILSTTRTAAPDLIESGREGFVVEPCDAVPIAERIEWALTHRDALRSMRAEARRAAESFSWERFRSALAQTVHNHLTCDLTQVMQSEQQSLERSEAHAF